MSKNIEYESRVCTVIYHADVPCIEMKWSGFAKAEEFREASENVLDTINRRGVTKVINNAVDMKILSLEVQNYLLNEWLPAASAAGFKHCAMMVSADFFSRLTIDKIIEQMDPAWMEIQFFESLLRAKVWLKQA